MSGMEPSDRGRQIRNGLARTALRPGLSALFLIGAAGFASLWIAPGPLGPYVVIAVAIGGYMALNIGANDVANNMGPAVGSRAVTLGGAILIAAVCEAAGAVLAGGDVVTTISRDLLSPDPSMGPRDFIFVMMAALLAASLWINLATILRAPVSTTHSVVGGVVGAGVAASGLAIVAWPTLGAIIASWVISPVMGGAIAAALLGFVKWAIIYRDDRLAAARRWVPLMVGLMAGVFAMYLALKGLSRVWAPSGLLVLTLGLAFLAAGTVAARPWVAMRSAGLDNRRADVSGLFNLPLVLAAALLSFAHGANDVANAVGPLTAIVVAAEAGIAAPDAVALPFWVLVIGGIGIAAGLAFYGPGLIRRVGEQITKMDAIRAYCVALSAAVTVLVASALGMPVSSTHTAIGAIFGVGFLREALSNRGLPNPAVRPRALFVEPSVLNETPEDAIRNHLSRQRRQLVRRRHVLVIVTAWVITVPAAALLAAAIYLLLATFATP